MSLNLRPIEAIRNISDSRPIVVDMDGTYFRHDLFQYQLVLALLSRPKLFFQAFLLLIRGRKALAKNVMAKAYPDFDFVSWPRNSHLHEILVEVKARGCHLVLCSGANETYVGQAADSLNLFDEWFGSSAETNLTSHNKKELLVAKYGENAFHYVGNSRADHAIYPYAKDAFVTHAFLDNVERQYSTSRWRLVLRQLRIKHWSKNLLLFLPLVAAHDYLDISSWATVGLYFLFLSLVASGTYILNDLSDLQHDLKHPKKQFRPLAQGVFSPFTALVLSGALILIPTFLSWIFVSPGSALLIVAYVLTTTVYSRLGKRVPILDVVLLAALYSLRVVAGGVVANVPFSAWLISFTFLVFYSMASVKRFVDLSGTDPRKKLAGRGYLGIDVETVSQIGVASGVASVVVYALWVTSAHVVELYSYPPLLLLGAPVLLYWVSHLWVSARRGRVDSDPIEWAMRDRSSIVSAGLFLLILVGSWLMGFIQW